MDAKLALVSRNFWKSESFVMAALMELLLAVANLVVQRIATIGCIVQREGISIEAVTSRSSRLVLIAA